MRVAFAGNPNSGKTTMYNALTGRNEKVGNWAGVTVDKKEALIRPAYTPGQTITAVDLPGAYSMSPFTSEESVTRDYIRNEQPDVLINIVDATNLSRSLFFTTQLLELGIPTVIALNKTDINEKKQTEIDVDALSTRLGCPVFETVSTNGQGLEELIRAALERRGQGQDAPYSQEGVDMSDPEAVRAADRERFRFVNNIVREVEQRKVLTRDHNFQDKLDAVLTHPIVGIPIFAAVMFLVFHLSQADGPLGLGVWMADLLVGWLEAFQGWVSGLIMEAGASLILHELLVNGIIGGAAAVVGFLPLVMVMYFLIALLEDCGYMARATVVLDPV